ncbi:MAG: TetR/AcrR family transcriptional regulator [Solirubrobacterales bacterium]
MTSTGDKATTARRPHDATATRQALLEAARAVFDEVGYDRATTREIGERAEVDPALIARYFDGKEGLFLAALTEVTGEELVDFAPRAVVEALVERWDERGHSPVSRALASPVLTDEVRQRTCAVVREHLLGALSEELRGRGVAAAELRAELLVAMTLGIAVTRSNRTLEKLASSSREEILAALEPIVDAFESA